MQTRYALLKENYKGIVFLVTASLAGLALMGEPPTGLSVEGYRALIVFFVAGVFWIGQVLPLAITSILAIVLLPLFEIMPSEDAYALFGNNAVFFIIGTLILSTGLVKTGLAKRAALKTLNLLGSKPSGLLAGVYWLSFLAAFFMPGYAAAAIMLPVALQVAAWLKLEPGKSEFGKGLFLALVWGSLSGGVATFLGGARNILAVELLEQTTGLTITFTEWLIAVVPISIVTGLIGYIYLQRKYLKTAPTNESIQAELQAESKRLGKLSDDEITMLVLLVATVLTWIFLSDQYGLAAIALVAAVVLFIFRIVKWEDAQELVNWGVVLMYGGAITLGVALEQTGASSFITEAILPDAGVHPWLIIIGFIVAALFLTEFMSNAAVVAMIFPVALSVAATVGINPIAMTLLIAVPAGYAFMLPIASPANALTYDKKFYGMKDAITGGFVMNCIAITVIIIGMLVWWPLIGIDLLA